jgi:glyoxalase family protein
MTFFDWPGTGPHQRGTNSITGTVFRVSSRDGLDFWEKRLREYSAGNLSSATFGGRSLLSFKDPEGQQLYIADDNNTHFEGVTWERPDIPRDHTLRGFYSVILSVPDITMIEPVLTRVLGFQEELRTTWIDGQTSAVIYQMNPGPGAGREVWLLEHPSAPRARPGAGGVHHAAFRVRDLEEQLSWQDRILSSGLRVTDVIDRFWFQSIYFRPASGILFEIATDGPGFAIDETPEALGEQLVLPPFLESRRDEIEAGLIPIGE